MSRRVSARTTKGVPPLRLGNESHTSTPNRPKDLRKRTDRRLSSEDFHGFEMSSADGNAEQQDLNATIIEGPPDLNGGDRQLGTGPADHQAAQQDKQQQPNLTMLCQLMTNLQQRFDDLERRIPGTGGLQGNVQNVGGQPSSATGVSTAAAGSISTAQQQSQCLQTQPEDAPALVVQPTKTPASAPKRYPVAPPGCIVVVHNKDTSEEYVEMVRMEISNSPAASCSRPGAETRGVEANANADEAVGRVWVPQMTPALQQNPWCDRRRLLDLPSFSGAPEDWPRFEQSYINTTSTYRYNNAENLIRLQKCLSGAAAKAVECLLIHDHHVPEVIRTLRADFGHPDLLVQSQIDRATDLRSITEARLEEVVPFASVVRNVAMYLDAPETQHHLANPTLLRELVGKLPLNRRIEWATKAEGIVPYPTIKHFSDWLSEFAHRVLRAAPPKVKTPGIGAKRVMLNVSEEADGAQSLECGYCAKPHDTNRCFAFKKLNAEDRWRAVIERNLCFGCLGIGHILPGCRSKQLCGVNGCERWHSPLLHARADNSSSDGRNRGGRARGGRPSESERAADGPRPNPFEQSGGRQSATTASTSASSAPAPVYTCRDKSPEQLLLFRVVPIVLHGAGRDLHTFALLDEGSSVTLIDESVADQLGLDGPIEELTMKWFSKQSSLFNSRRLAVEISGKSTQGRRYPINVRTIRNLSLPTQTVDPDELCASNQHLRSVPLCGYRNAKPTVLIGLDHHYLGTPIEMVTSDDDSGLVAARTKLGWIVYGSDVPANEANVLLLAVDGEQNEDYNALNELVRSFIYTEDFGVKQPRNAIESDDDIRARQIMASTTRRIGDRYETGLLWRTEDVVLPSSFDMALQRLESVESKMRREPSYAAQYIEQMDSYIAKGYASLLREDEVRAENSRTFYLPHFAVRNPNKPGKFRLVFDAAAKVCGISLNSMLLSGPDANVPLARLLFQFRIGLVGICADICEMFSQVRIRPDDQSAQRFLWRGGDASIPPAVYVMRSMTFGATCSPASAQYVKNFNAAENESEFPEAAEAIRQRHYVDDYVSSFATPAIASRITADVIEVHRRGGFTLRGIVSNDQSVLRSLGVDTGAGEQISLDSDATIEKILGMSWSTADDTFCFKTRFCRVDPEVLSGIKRPTKRTILSTSMSVFDPFGMLADFVLPAKLMVQELYRLGLDWDEPAPDDVNEKWQAWRSEIPRTQLLRMPRCYSTHICNATNLQLHVFVDASELAFAAVAFWRISMAERVDLMFVAGKAKVAPAQLLSVPRLELNAAVLGARLMDEIRSCHDLRIDKVVMWSDSETVLKWVRSNQRKYKPYVAFRVAEITESAPVSWWRWVPTALNVADDATRVKHPPCFDPDSRWLRGPAWLREKEDAWPTQREMTCATAEPFPEELRAQYVGIAVGQMEPIDMLRFSSYQKLCRTIARIRRFSWNALAKKRGQTPITSAEVGACEMDAAMLCVCRMVQKEIFVKEYAAMSAGEAVGESSSIFGLKPYLDEEGIIRLHGRTDAADNQYMQHEAKRPILLPRHHLFAVLVVRFYHEQMAHQLVDATIAAIRQRFWVPQLRILVRSVQRACNFCKMRAARPQPPIMGQLPRDRLTPFVRPFTHTGMDYFGPVNVKIGRRHEKRWVALFTCLGVRAVHLEIAANLSTDSCLLCIRNLCNIRGVPALIRCDNGTNFVGARNALEKDETFFDPHAIQRELSKRGIEWRMNCPANPEAGGVWERLVQSVKRVLAITLKELAPEVETLRAHLLEAANLVNSRPLTHLPVDPDEPEPLTPNHFLVGGSNLVTVPDPSDHRSLCTREQWVRCREMTRRFWEQWVKDYLPELTRRSVHYPARPPAKQGDIVFVCDAAQSRSRWLKGRILETAVGSDGLVRRARVQTTEGVYWRPVSKLAILDVGPPHPDQRTGAGMSPSTS